MRTWHLLVFDFFSLHNSDLDHSATATESLKHFTSASSTRVVGVGVGAGSSASSSFGVVASGVWPIELSPSATVSTLTRLIMLQLGRGGTQLESTHSLKPLWSTADEFSQEKFFARMVSLTTTKVKVKSCS